MGQWEPIHISAERGNDAPKFGEIKHVLFENNICKGENGMLLYGSDKSIPEDISLDCVRFELTDTQLNGVPGGNIDLRGSNLQKSLFESDIPGRFAQYIEDVPINDFQLQWTDTRRPFFSNGIELNNFEDVRIDDFTGRGSPINSWAYKIYAENGKNLIINGDTGVWRKMCSDKSYVQKLLQQLAKKRII